ncbi:ATP-dependent RNA helicase DbpA [Ferrimonas kyonanensis]|uniref:ATP-dependent RNA helicase DbpA n=1 Tax=Ferrimonas kyonanensis TaxID=364763 RepID=UPI0003F56F24|nr:ATP-dependent RNA helicase DbpA [Ferrimonas kyonanensis]
MSTAFSSLPLSGACLDNLSQLGFSEMTPIQSQSLPAILAGQDVVAKAKTGSGKTVAFGLGLLNKLDLSVQGTQAMVLCPTRELADQVTKEIRRLARAIPNVKVLTLSGGVPMGPQMGSLDHGAHVIVGTPGRILKHMKSGRIRLKPLNTLVFDEADRMLDMGFEADIDAILELLPQRRQTLLFSATYPEQIDAMTHRVQRDPLMVTVEGSEAQEKIEQKLVEVSPAQKDDALLAVLAQYQPESTVVFCNTRRACQQVAEVLEDAGVYVVALHGDRDQRERDQTLVRFASKSVSVLVATDVAARGLDIKDLSLVVNYDIAFESEVHVHRIGRTGRAGTKGRAISLAAGGELHRVEEIEALQGQPIPRLPFSKLSVPARIDLVPPMVTLSIGAGRKSKLRAGDILGALTAKKRIPGKAVGKIEIADRLSYVAIERQWAKEALQVLQGDKIKGRNLIVRMHR